MTPNLPVTRQVLRRTMVQIAFGEITRQFGGESRKARRLMARRLAAKEWKRAHGGL